MPIGEFDDDLDLLCLFRQEDFGIEGVILGSLAGDLQGRRHWESVWRLDVQVEYLRG